MGVESTLTALHTNFQGGLRLYNPSRSDSSHSLNDEGAEECSKSSNDNISDQRYAPGDKCRGQSGNLKD